MLGDALGLVGDLWVVSMSWERVERVVWLSIP